MDDSWVIENFDSLWFFSNIFASRSQILGSAEIHEKEVIIEESEKPVTPVVEIKLNECLNVEIEESWCYGYDEFAAEIEAEAETEIFQAVIIEDVEIRSLEKEERRSRSRSRRKRSKNLRRKILGEMDLGFYLNEEISSGSLNFDEICGSQGTKMPPLSDGMAMKEHLKSWAYAVACTVR